MTAGAFEGQSGALDQNEAVVDPVDPLVQQTANDLQSLGVVRRLLERDYPYEAKVIVRMAARLRDELDGTDEGRKLLDAHDAAEANSPRGVVAIRPRPAVFPPRRF